MAIRLRGVTAPLTVMILTAVSLVVALLVYNYFTSYYRIVRVSHEIESIRLSASETIDSSLVYTSVYVDEATGYTYYCLIVSISNKGAVTAIGATILPLERAGGYMALSEAYKRIPVDRSTGERLVELFEIADVDGDGVEEVIGSGGVVSSRVNCGELAGLNGLDPLMVKDEFVIVDSMSVAELASRLGLSGLEVPVWEVTLSSERRLFLVIITVPDVMAGELSSVELVLFKGISDNYYSIGGLTISLR